jgi:transcriptional regulator with XRE-family HTH domain
MQLKLNTPEDVALTLRDRFQQRRLDMGLSQAGLANRSGVNVHSLGRFERTGLISFESLLKLALVLKVLEDFDRVAKSEAHDPASQKLDDVLATRRRQRGRGK